MKKSVKCDKGFKDGSCCCNCKNFVILSKHPWNIGESNGKISEHFGYACVILNYEDVKNKKGQIQGTFMTHKHGMCEFHTPVDELQKEFKIDKLNKNFNI